MNQNDLDDNHSFLPIVETESTDLSLPDNQLIVEYLQRQYQFNVKEVSFKLNPTYLNSCYDEFTRNFVSVHVGKRLQDTVPLVKYDTFSDRQNIIQHYNPGFSNCYSTFKRSPLDSRYLLNGRVHSDFNLIFRVNSFSLTKQKPFEPLFLSFCVYTQIDDKLQRICETFHFDCTHNSIRKLYTELYKPDDSNFKSVNVGDGYGTDGFLNKIKVTLPQELRSRDLFITVQLSKILTTTADAAIAPYKASPTPHPDTLKHIALCNRLIQFRQPIAIGIERYRSDNGKQLDGEAKINMKFFSQRGCISDEGIQQYIRELFPSEGTAPYNRMGEPLEIDMSFTIADLGRDDQVLENFACFSMTSTFSMDCAPMYLIPSQIPSSDSPFQFRVNMSSLEPAGPSCSMVAVRELLPLLPAEITAARDLNRKIKANVDNTLFLYPFKLEKFKKRNLCLKIELVEFQRGRKEKSDQLPTSLSSIPMKQLCNIYNVQCITGPAFVPAAYTRVSYHNTSPSLNDEIKIKLPDVLTGKHWLKFTVLHCHVKSSNDGLLSRMMRSSIETPIVEFIELGVGYLPLLSNDISLLEDNAYTINITSTEAAASERLSIDPSSASEIPIVRVRVKSVCSLHSSDKAVQTVLANHPVPLGRMPSSLRSDSTIISTIHSTISSAPQESAIFESLTKFTQAASSECAKHFLPLIKLLIYSMTAGSCVLNELYFNPYKHSEVRCQSFLTLLQLLGKLLYEVKNGESTEDKEFLTAYVDYIFDEDIPLKKYNHFFPECESPEEVRPKMSASSSKPASSLVGKRHRRERKSLTDTELVSVIQDVNESESERRLSKIVEGMDKALAGLHEKYVHVANNGEDELTTDSIVVECLADNMKTIVEGSYSSDSTDSFEDSSETPQKILPPLDGKKTHRRNKSAGYALSPSIDALHSFEAQNYASPFLDGRNFDETDTPYSYTSEHTSFHHNGKLPVRESEVGNGEYSYNLDNLLSDSPIAPLDSMERHSWGQYITDAMWVSGGFVSSADVLEGNRTLPENDKSSAYLDEIVDHIIQQVSRVVEEIVVSDSVVAISPSVSSKATSDSSSEGGGLWIGNKSDKAFHSEKSWHLSHQDMSVLKDVLMNTLNKTSDLDLPRDVFQRPAYCPVKVTIQSVQSKYDAIEGYRERWGKIARLKTPPEAEEGDRADQLFKNRLVGVQWWPWLYEVLVFQWGSVLTKILVDSGQLRGSDSIIGTYPATVQVTPKAVVSKSAGNISPLKDVRSLLVEYGPFLLQLVFKSLSLRLIREKKRTPVLLDEQFFSALENLVNLLALEILTLCSKMWASKKLNTACIGFLRSLLSIVAPVQVIRLLRSYFHSLKSKQNKAEETELRQQAVDIICKFDYLVPVNFPFTMDAPQYMFNLNVHTPKSFPLSLLAYTSCGIRYGQTPAPYWLIHTIIEQIFISYKQEEAKVRITSIEILRDLLVKLSFDARYQSTELRQRVICMFLPLIKEIVDIKPRLMQMKHDSIERRETIVILFYILQEVSRPLLRSILRMLCATSNNNNNTKPSSFKSRSGSFASLGSNAAAEEAREAKSRKSSVSQQQPYFTKYSFSDFSLCGMLHLFHLALDTFEIPQNTDGSVTVLSPNVMISSSSSKEQAATAKTVYESSDKLKKLEDRLQNKKAVRKSNTGAGNSRSGEERKWIVNARKMHSAASERLTSAHEQLPANEPVSKQTICAASNSLSKAVTTTIITVLLTALHECPKEIMSIAGIDPDFTYLAPEDLKIGDKSMLVGMADFKYLDLIRMCLTVLLHILYCNQEPASYELTFSAAKTVLEKFGAKIFLVSVDDSLQDWIRISLRHSCSSDEGVASAAVRFIIYILHSCFHYLGSFSVVSNTILAVLNDVIDTLLESNRSSIVNHSDEDRILSGLTALVESMHETALHRDNSGMYSDTITVSFLEALQRFAKNLGIVLLAHADMRRFLHNPVGYDFYGANLLDPPVDDPRVTALFCRPREQRKQVKPDNAAKKVLQVEEVTARFLQAAEVYNPICLPRFRMLWLENLARMNEFKQNRAESAEIRWKIYNLCVQVANTWRTQWVPRPPLEWSLRQAVVPQQSMNAGTAVSDLVPALVSTTSATSVTLLNFNSVLQTGENQDAPESLIVANAIPLFNGGAVPIASTLNSAHASRSYSNSIVIDTNKGSSNGENRNFLNVLTTALDKAPLRAWADSDQYMKHMEMALSIVSERYFAVNLIHLAERASNHLMTLYRTSNRTDMLVKEYGKIVTSLKLVGDKGVTSSMAIGNFYRVFYDGAGVPWYLKGKEFIYRNGVHLHVSEFMKLLCDQLRSIVADGVEVKIVNDNAQNASKAGSHDEVRFAFITMNSVKLLMESHTGPTPASGNFLSTSTAAPGGSRPSSLSKKGSSKAPKPSTDKGVEVLNQVSRFSYSVPFTKDANGKAHAKNIDEQWMRITSLTVKEPFPFMLTRQLVQSRSVRELSPIEVATHDIQEKIDEMGKELEATARSSSDNNNLMRLIQGTVLPQVNSGVKEVARVFLGPGSNADYAAAGGDDEQSSRQSYRELVNLLKWTLLEFLSASKQLLGKAHDRLVTRSDAASEQVGSLNSMGSANGESTPTPNLGRPTTTASSAGGGGGGSGGPVTAENQNRRWLEEMDIGYRSLISDIYPYLKDVCDIGQLIET